VKLGQSSVDEVHDIAEITMLGLSLHMDARFANAVVSWVALLQILPGGLVSMCCRLEQPKMVLWQLKPWFLQSQAETFISASAVVIYSKMRRAGSTFNDLW